MNSVQIIYETKAFGKVFPAFLKTTFNFEHFEKKLRLIAYIFPKLQTAKEVLM